jgi:tripartite-type tricarboxylate transporter receptor subunit TctC
MLGAAAVAAPLLVAAAAQGQSVADFYKGRQVTFVVSTSSGGGYDAYGRLTSRHMAHHIPGHPTIVTRNMPGAAHVLAANWLYNQAPKDGSVLATVGQTIPDFQLFDGKGVEYDARNFNWIGNVIAGNNTIALWHTSGVTSIDQLREKELVIGASGRNSTSAFYPTVMNNVLGTKFKIISGYPGGNEIMLAMERGEVMGRGSNAWSSWKATKPDWLRDKKIFILVQIGPKKEPDLPDVPLLTDFARNAEERMILNTFSASIAVGRPILTTPGVPADRVAALREAFHQTMTDPVFLAEAKKAKFDIKPIYGEELQKIVAEFLDTPPAVVEKVKAAMVHKDIIKDLDGGKGGKGGKAGGD